MPARLTLYLPQRPARVHDLRDGDDYVVGRDADCPLQVDDDRVSRRHALLRRREDGWSVVDLRSKNGTQVDGVDCRAATALRGTSWVSFGGLLARFEVVSEEALARATAEHLRRWRSSVEMQRQLAPSLGLAPLLDRLLDSVLSLSETERGFVLLADGDGELAVAALRGAPPEALLEAGFAGSVGAVTRSLAERRTVVTSDAWHDPRLASRSSVVERSIRALVCLPLLALDRVLGALYADSGRPGKAFTELDVEILEGLAGHAALAIAVARLDAELAGMAASLPHSPATPPPNLPRWRDFLMAHEERREGA
jgi:putative methionine-R-sulfoxide reductase with GAF domain